MDEIRGGQHTAPHIRNFDEDVLDAVLEDSELFRVMQRGRDLSARRAAAQAAEYAAKEARKKAQLQQKRRRILARLSILLLLAAGAAALRAVQVLAGGNGAKALASGMLALALTMLGTTLLWHRSAAGRGDRP